MPTFIRTEREFEELKVELSENLQKLPEFLQNLIGKTAVELEPLLAQLSTRYLYREGEFSLWVETPFDEWKVIAKLGLAIDALRIYLDVKENIDKGLDKKFAIKYLNHSAEQREYIGFLNHQSEKEIANEPGNSRNFLPSLLRGRVTNNFYKECYLLIKEHLIDRKLIPLPEISSKVSFFLILYTLGEMGIVDKFPIDGTSTNDVKMRVKNAAKWATDKFGYKCRISTIQNYLKRSELKFHKHVPNAIKVLSHHFPQRTIQINSILSEFTTVSPE